MSSHAPEPRLIFYLSTSVIPGPHENIRSPVSALVRYPFSFTVTPCHDLMSPIFLSLIRDVLTSNYTSTIPLPIYSVACHCYKEKWHVYGIAIYFTKTVSSNTDVDQ